MKMGKKGWWQSLSYGEKSLSFNSKIFKAGHSRKFMDAKVKFKNLEKCINSVGYPFEVKIRTWGGIQSTWAGGEKIKGSKIWIKRNLKGVRYLVKKLNIQINKMLIFCSFTITKSFLTLFPMGGAIWPPHLIFLIMWNIGTGRRPVLLRLLF